MSNETPMTRREKTFIAAWCAFILVGGILAFFVLNAEQRRHHDNTSQRDRDRMSASSVIAGRTEPERTPPPGHENDVPETVKVGLYVDHIADVSIVHSEWKVDFFLWFLWTGDGPSPGETFKITNGEILTRTVMQKTDDGPRHYVLYRVTAQITKNFNLSRFPIDLHLLTIAIEDQARQSYQLNYVAEEAGSDVSSRVAVPGYAITGKQTVVKPHSYKTAMGSPALPATYRATYSQFTFGISIARPSWSLLLKMFIAMYLSVAMALGGLFVRGAGERLGLASTALFVAVVNGLTISTLTPDTGIYTLSDHVNNVGYSIIGLLILQAIIYHRYFADPTVRPEATKWFDRLTFVVVGALTVALNAGLLLSGL